MRAYICSGGWLLKSGNCLWVNFVTSFLEFVG